MGPEHSDERCGRGPHRCAERAAWPAREYAAIPLATTEAPVDKVDSLGWYCRCRLSGLARRQSSGRASFFYPYDCSATRGECRRAVG